ncbi:MAG: putative lipid II flippase FtsW [Acidimicrobiia bacterium]|nr:MAG: putative lipid II flippase FtsW [Acidimicrobiia bacterium]
MSSSTVTSIATRRSAATVVAAERDRNQRTRIFLLSVVGVLLVIGLGATLSASSVMSAEDGAILDLWVRQAIAAGAGVAVMLVASRVPYALYRRLAVPIWGSAVGLLLLVLVVGRTAGGSSRWLDLGVIDIQPSELAKFGVAVLLAAVYAKKEERGELDQFGHVFVPLLAVVGTVVGLVMLQPDLGTSVLIGAVAFGVLFSSKAPLRFVGAFTFFGGLAATLLAVIAPYRFDRVRAWLDPAGDPSGIAYHLNQSLLALGSGGATGIGLGTSRSRWDYLPNAHTDFIFSIIGEELGFAGATFVVMLFAVLTILGVAVAMRAPDRFGAMLAAGITTWLGFQAFVNIGGVTGMIPITGMTLPFISFGGSSLVMALGAVGVLLNIASRGASGRSR